MTASTVLELGGSVAPKRSRPSAQTPGEASNTSSMGSMKVMDRFDMDEDMIVDVDEWDDDEDDGANQPTLGTSTSGSNEDQRSTYQGQRSCQL